MSFLAPGMLGLLALLGPLVLLYVLRPKRAERRVGSTLLWQQVARERSAERPFQRLVARASLLLQALVLILTALALARPTVRSPASTSRLAIVVDVSASMHARSDGGTRLDAARALAKRLIRESSSTTEVTIVEASRSPRLVHAPSRDRAELVRALDDLHPRAPDADLAEALRLARDRLRGRGRIVVLTDLAFDEPIDVDVGVPIEVRRIGSGDGNLGIVAADARIEQVDADTIGLALFARVASASSSPREAFLRVEREDGSLVAARRVAPPPGGESSAALSARIAADDRGRVLVFRLAGADGRPYVDAQPLDDRIVVRAPSLAPAPVVVVGEVGDALVRALRAHPQATVFATTPAELPRALADPAFESALVVARGAVPAAAAGHDVLLVDAQDVRSLGLRLGERRPSSVVVRIDAADPDVRFVDPEEWGIAALAPIAGDDAKPLLVSEVGTAIASVEREGRHVVVLGFDPDRSTFRQQPSFVVFVHDVVEAAEARALARRLPDGCFGEPIRLAPSDGPGLRLRTPDGSSRSLSASSTPVIETEDVGVYRLGEGAGERLALRRLCDAREGDLRARGQIATRSAARERAQVTQAGSAEITPFLALAALVFLGLETLHASRRGRS